MNRTPQSFEDFHSPPAKTDATRLYFAVRSPDPRPEAQKETVMSRPETWERPKPETLRLRRFRPLPPVNSTHFPFLTFPNPLISRVCTLFHVNEKFFRPLSVPRSVALATQAFRSPSFFPNHLTFPVFAPYYAALFQRRVRFYPVR